MEKRIICFSVCILLLFVCACKKDEAAVTMIVGQEWRTEEKSEVTEEVITTEAVTESMDKTVEEVEITTEVETKEEVKPESTVVLVENPSWEYYIANETEVNTEPYSLSLIEEVPNAITDVERWFSDYGLELGVEESDEEYSCYVDDDSLIHIYKGSTQVAELDFYNYRYSEDYVEADFDFIDENVYDAKIKDGILYVSTFHVTYAKSAPSNGYITAIDLEDYSVLWKSAPLVCNSYNFTIVEDVIFCGYGFTAEPDYLNQLDIKTGVVLAQQEVKSRPDYIIYKDGNLYVRTYDTNYVFAIHVNS